MQNCQSFRGISNGVRLSLLPLLWVAGATLLQAQDFDRYRPNPPVRPLVRPSVPRSSPPAAVGSAVELVGRLRGVKVLDSGERVQDPVKPFDGVRIDPAADLTVAVEDEFQRVVQPYLGQPITILALNEMARDIVSLYRRSQQPAVDVIMPPGQDITDGVVQIVIKESRIGAVRFEGNCQFDECLLQSQSWLRPGQRIYEPCLQNELVWLNRNPFRDVNVVLQPGSRPGTTDVVYNVTEQTPVRVFGGYEDSGTRATGLERLNTGFQLGNVFGQDHQLSYQYTTDAYLQQGTRGIGVHSFTYEAPIFENRDTWMMFGSWGDVNAAVDLPGGARVLSDGTAWQLSGRYRHTLCETKCQVDSFAFGIDTKGTDTFADFGGPLAGNPNSSSVHVVNLVAGISSQQQHDNGSTIYALDMFFSPGGLLTNNRAKDFKNTRAGALSTYAYARGYIEELYQVNACSDLVLRLTGQLSTGELLPTEQLGFGGYNTIRGYDFRTLNGDNGYIANLEYRSRPLERCFRGRQTSLTTLAFADMGQQYNWGSSPGLPNADVLASVGVGVRYLIDSSCSLRFDYGVPLTSAANNVQNEHGRVHIGAVIAY